MISSWNTYAYKYHPHDVAISIRYTRWTGGSASVVFWGSTGSITIVTALYTADNHRPHATCSIRAFQECLRSSEENVGLASSTDKMRINKDTSCLHIIINVQSKCKSLVFQGVDCWSASLAPYPGKSRVSSEKVGIEVNVMDARCFSFPWPRLRAWPSVLFLVTLLPLRVLILSRSRWCLLAVTLLL